MTYHTKTAEEIIKYLNSDEKNGLSSSQISSLQAQYGENKLREKKKKGMLARFLDQFKDVMIIILLIAAVISFGIAAYENNPKEYFEPLLKVFEEKGIKTDEAEVIRRPEMVTEITDPAIARQVLRLVDRMEELDDVQLVTANYEIADEIADQLEEE